MRVSEGWLTEIAGELEIKLNYGKSAPPHLAKVAKPAAPRIALMILALACVTWFTFLCFISTLRPENFVVDEDFYLLPILYGLEGQNWLSQVHLLNPIPSYLYFWLYSFLPAPNIHEAAKLLNAGFIAATALPAYAIARRYLTPAFAATFAIVVMCSPISSFVLYVMPEPVYFFGFWLIVLAMLSALGKSPLLAALVSGALIGVLSLIKPHALALALGSSLFLLLQDRRRVNGVFGAFIVFISYYFIRTTLAYILTGQWLFSVAGSNYATILGSGYHVDFWATAVNTLGHICAVAILIAVPLTITVVLVFQRILGRTEVVNPPIDRITDLGLLACCMLAAMLAMTVYFSQSEYQLNPFVERITRLHGRYYDYVLPLFVLVTVSLWKSKFDLTKLCGRWIVIVLCVAAIAAAAVIIDAFDASYIDFPDLALAIVDARYANLVLMALLFVPLVLSCFHTRIGTANVIFYATLCCSVLSVSASAAIIKYYSITFVPHNPVDVAFFKSTEQHELQRLVGRTDGIIVAIPNDYDVYRTLFYLQSLTPVVVTSVIRDEDFSNKTHWAVLLPGVHYAGASPTTREGALTLVWRQERNNISIPSLNSE